MAPNESLLATGNTGAVRAKVEATWAAFVAPVFEELCRDWVARFVRETGPETGMEAGDMEDGPRLALFAKSGFTPGLEAVAQREGVMLVTAEEVVAA